MPNLVEAKAEGGNVVVVAGSKESLLDSKISTACRLLMGESSYPEVALRLAI